MANDINNDDLLRIFASGNTEELERLLKDKNINSKDHNGRTLMHQAAGLGKVEIMKCLVEKYGADIYARDDGDISPMDVAIANIESIKCLKELGVDLEKKNSEGRTAIFGAAAFGKIESIKCLKTLGANVNAVDNNGATPIFAAAMAGQIASIECLVALGADVHAEDRNGCTSMFLAVFVGQTESMKCLKKLGARLDVKAGNGMSLMEAAYAAGHSEDSEVLGVLKRLLDADKKNEGSFTGRDGNLEKGIFIDPRDSKKYRTVTIGKQTWMAENLNYEASGSKCYDNNPANAQKYGRLYDWETAKRACPPGWHLPSDKEWQELVDFAGGDAIAGKKLKATSGWNENGNGTDDYGFSSLPGGYGYSDGYFNGVGYLGNWWSSTEYSAAHAWYRFVSYNLAYVFRNYIDKSILYSVRCVQN
jgi:uncharacterized protein (TIGR02145 family)